MPPRTPPHGGTPPGHGGTPPGHDKDRPPGCSGEGGVVLPPGGGWVEEPEGGVTPEGGEHPRPPRRPNILVIFGDDIGQWNISAYNLGAMGYRTPNIDRIAAEGVLFTDAYADQSCTAGRSSFVLGQSPIRTGLTAVGFPGDLFGISMTDPTIANLLQGQGYACGQFGKNHLGDRDWHLPTMHGFDTFFGNLYHLNAEEEPEDPDFPTDPRYPRPRGVLRCTRTQAGVLPRQEIEDTGPLTIERMPGIDEEFLGAAQDFIRGRHDEGKPWFCWFNTSRMHVWTRLKPESEGVTGLGLFPDGMVEHDGHVGVLLDLLDELGVADNTIVLYATDNGAEVQSWPDGGCTPFRGEKGLNWEGAYRVPMVARWPGHFPAGAQCNGIFSLLDWLPTLLAAAGEPNVKRKLLTGMAADGRPWKAFLDGYNMLPALTQGEAWPRREFYYVGYDGQLAAVRFGQWKIHFRYQARTGFAGVQNQMDPLQIPIIVNLRSDPFEKAHEEPGWGYEEFMFRHAFLAPGAAAVVVALLASLQDWPPHLAEAAPPPEMAKGVTGTIEDSPVVQSFRGGVEQLRAIVARLGISYAD